MTLIDSREPGMFVDWNDVALDLRTETTLALDEGVAPEPLLVAFEHEDPLAVVCLRPFERGDVLGPLIEVRSLLLPLGATRLALGLPARARREDDATTGATPRTVLLLATAASDEGGPARIHAHLHPLEHDGSCWRWLDEVIELTPDSMDVLGALAVLLENRGELCDPSRAEAELRAQLSRCLRLGHIVALAPATADRLDPPRGVRTPSTWGRGRDP